MAAALHAATVGRAFEGIPFGIVAPLLEWPYDATRCVNHVVRRREFTHRKKRKGELGAFELFEAFQTEASSIWVDRVLPVTSSVMGEVPILLTPGVDLTVPFGSWSVTFRDPTEFQGSRRALKSASPIQLMPPEPPPFVAVFAPGFTTLGNSVSCGGSLFTTGGCLWESGRLVESWPTVASAVLPQAVALCDAWCKGYYHFTHEHLPRVALVHGLLASGNATLVLPFAMNDFQRQFLHGILGVQRIRVGAAFARLLLHPAPMRCGNTYSGTLHRFRAIVFRRLNLSMPFDSGLPPMLLFAERSKYSRMARNYDAIKAAVVDKFKGRLTFVTTQGREHVAQQVRWFHAASIVLGPHGANLANAMFMRPGAHLLEMASMRKGNMCYYTTAMRVGLRYHFIPHLQGKDDAYDLDPHLVMQHVERALLDLSVD